MPPKKKSYSAAELNAIVARAVAEAMANHESRRSEETVNTTSTPVIKPCSYKDFLNCKPLNFKGTEGAIELVRWIEKMESVFRICNCPEDCKVKYSTCTFLEGVLTWWNSYIQAVGIDAAYQLPWEELKKKLRDEYCPNEELQRLEEEFWNLTVQGTDIISYTTKFQQLALLCPSMVDPERKRIERYIKGLPESVQGNVISSKPANIQGAIRMAHELMASVARREKTGNPSKRKWEGNPTTPSKKVETGKAESTYTSDKKEYKGSKPYCSKCKLHHDGQCPCTKCKRFGHLTKDCKATTTDTNTSAPKTCYECNGTGHFKKDCPKLKEKDFGPARGRAYVLRPREDNDNPRLA